MKIGAAIIATIALTIISYIGIQSVRQNTMIHAMESRLDELGFEKSENSYYLEDAAFRYDVYIFDRPAVWKWNQELAFYEKFVVGSYMNKDSDLSEMESTAVTMRKTDDFTTLSISRVDYNKEGSPQITEYTLDKNGEIKHVEKMDEEDYGIYTKLQSEIREAAKRMDTIYLKLYK